jgi:hypothetical protein
VIRIGNIVAEPALKDPNPLAPTDRRAVEARIELGPEASEEARKYVHMEVEVAFPDAES